MRTLCSHLGLLLCLLLAGPASAFDTLIGEAFDLDSDELLYREYHRYTRENGQLATAEVEYRAPDGRLIGTKQIDYRPSLYRPAFHTELYDGRYVEGMEYVDDGLRVYQRKGEDAREKSRIIPAREAMVADAGFNNYVARRFDDLVDDRQVQFQFVVPSRLTAIKFDARRTGERKLEATPVVDFRVELSSFLSLFIDPLILSYDPVSRQLIEYRGLSNVRAPDGEPYVARIRYPQLMRIPAAPERTARQTPPVAPY